MAELEAVIETVATRKSTGRGWFVATSIVAVVGIAVVAWLTLLRPADEEIAVQAPETASSNDAPAQSLAPAAEKSEVVAADKSPPAQTKAPADGAVATAAAPRAAAPPATPIADKPIDKPADEKPVEKAPAPVAEAKAPPAPAPSAKKTAPAKVAKAAAPPPPSKKTASKDSPPRTRAEQITALLASAEEHLRADRLTAPKEKNAIWDYFTVLAMDTQNEAARRGVERVVERYVAKSESAINAREFEKANEYLDQARFVLDAMELRNWPKASYYALFTRYRDANQLLAKSR